MGTIPGQRAQVSVRCYLTANPHPKELKETNKDEKRGFGSYRKAVGKGGRGRTGANVAETQLRTDTGT